MPEVWRHDGETFSILRLRPGGIHENVDANVSLPPLTDDDVARWVEDGLGSHDHGEWTLRLQNSTRDVLSTRPRPQAGA
ncbi:MAG: hypothetical protein U0835_13335 [Isosphaeraceae bacterium]